LYNASIANASVLIPILFSHVFKLINKYSTSKYIAIYSKAHKNEQKSTRIISELIIKVSFAPDSLSPSTRISIKKAGIDGGNGSGV
jgi:hypothetical protein